MAHTHPKGSEALDVVGKIARAFRYYRRYGPSATLVQTCRVLLGRTRAQRYDRFIGSLDGRDQASIFTEIYQKGLWRGGASHSGAGSESWYTENLRFHLPIIFERFGIRTIVDAPCGDFNWMRLVPLKRTMNYIGVDIVPALVAENQARYGDARHRFEVGNIVSDPLPHGDILICRDCLFHLGNADIVGALKNFAQSGIPYLFTSTHVNSSHIRNEDIKAGDFRLIDLFSEPFSLPGQVHYRVEDYVPPFPAREMCLWDRAQVVAALSASCSTGSAYDAGARKPIAART